MCKTAREFVTGIGDCVSEYETVLEGARKLTALGVDALPVCGDDRTVVGMLWQRDVVRIVAERRDPDAIRIGRLAAIEVAVADADAPIADVWATMVERDLDRIPVIADGRLIGVLRRGDLGAATDLGERAPLAGRTVVPA